MGIHKPELKWSRQHVGRPQAQGYNWDQQVPASYRELTQELTHCSSGKEESLPLCTTDRRIRSQETRTRQIPSQRNHLNLQLPICATEEVTLPTMQPSQITSASPPQVGGEGSLDNTFQEDFSNITVDLTAASLATGNNLCRDFNTVTSELNTPDITDVDIGNILGHPDIDLADLINTADTDIDTRMETREDVWGYESFDVFQTPPSWRSTRTSTFSSGLSRTKILLTLFLQTKFRNNQKMSRESQLLSLSPHPPQHSTSTPSQRRRRR